LVWYNLGTTPPEGRSPVIEARDFSSEAVLRILARMGVKTIRSLGIDGGRSYASAFGANEASGLLANNASSFDLQFDRLQAIVEEHDLDYRPLVEPLRIFVGTEESQLVAQRVLEYSIRKSASAPIEFVPMLDLSHPLPRDPANRPRTTFSFYRFMIPELCGYRGRAVYLDADMLVFGDIRELADLPLDPYKVLCSTSPPTGKWSGYDAVNFGARSSVMVLDCGRLTWDIADIVRGLDHGDYRYEELMSEMLLEPEDVGDRVPASWNDLEHYDPSTTKLLHFTVEPMQPWKNDDNPLAGLWMSLYREAVEAGAVPPDEVEALIARGFVKPSLQAALRRAPSRLSVVTNASLELPLAQERLAAANRRIADLEARLAAIESSSSWRLGSRMVRLLRTPRRLLGRDRAAEH
jgi:hypothetical protein